MLAANHPPAGVPARRPAAPARAGRGRDRSPTFWPPRAALGKRLLGGLAGLACLALPLLASAAPPELARGEAAWRRLVNDGAPALAGSAAGAGIADPRLACCLVEAAVEAGEDAAALDSLEAACAPSLADLVAGCRARLEARADDAESLLARARDACVAAADRDGELVARQQLGALLLDAGRPAEALAEYRESLVAAEALDRPLAAARACLQIGRALVRSRQIGEAAPHLDRAARDAAALGVPLWTGDAEIALSVVARLAMDLDAALAHRRRALAAYEAAGSLAGQARATHYIATIHIFRGELTTAMGLLRRALDLAREAADPGEQSGCLGDLANLNYLLGDEELALTQYEEAVALGAGPRRAGFWRSNIGSILTDLGRYEAALAELALAREDLAAAGDHRSEANALSVRGHCLCRMGRHDEGLADLERSAALAREWESPMHEAYAVLATGRCRLARGDLPAAGAAFDAALALAGSTGFYDILEGALLGRARVARRQGNPAAALPLLERAMASAEEVRRRSGGAARVQTGSFGEANDIYAEAIELLHDLHVGEPAAGHDRRAFAVVQRARARSFLDLLSEAEVDLQCRADPAFREREAEILARIGELSAGLAAAPPAERSALERDLAAQEDALDLLEAEFRRSDPRYAELRYPHPAGLAELQGSVLREGELLLEYALGDSASHVWAVGRTGFRFLRLPPRARLEAEVRELLPLLRDYNATGPDPAYYVAAATALARSLLEPLREELAAAGRVVVIPDGILHYVPFEALLIRPAPAAASYRELPYLLREHDVSYAPSASALAHLRAGDRRQPPAAADLLLVGDPVPPAPEELSVFVRAAAGGAPPPLAGARRELDFLARRVGGERCRALRGDGATLGDLVSVAAAEGPFRWVHLATHGLFNERRPRYSGLLLGRGDDGADDGFVTVAEVFGLDLPCELVTLSACSSALGEQVTGEGMVGLTRGFLYAGAASVVASLWDVPDRPTGDLMSRFYATLSGEGPARPAADRTRALAEAKRSVLAAGDEDRDPQAAGDPAHPAFWAAFVLTGDGL